MPETNVNKIQADKRTAESGGQLRKIAEHMKKIARSLDALSSVAVELSNE